LDQPRDPVFLHTDQPRDPVFLHTDHVPKVTPSTLPDDVCDPRLA